MNQEEKISEQFRETHLSFSRFLFKVLTELDLSLPQYTILYSISLKGPMTMTEASLMLGVSKPAVTHLVDQLEKRSMITRCSSEEDRRVNRLEILPAGVAAIEKVQRKKQQIMSESIRPFGKQQREFLMNFMKELCKNVASVSNEDKTS